MTAVDTCDTHDSQYQYNTLRTKRGSFASTLHFFKALYMPTRIVKTPPVQNGRAYYISGSFVLIVLDVQ